MHTLWDATLQFGHLTSVLCNLFFEYCLHTDFLHKSLKSNPKPLPTSQLSDGQREGIYFWHFDLLFCYNWLWFASFLCNISVLNGLSIFVLIPPSTDFQNMINQSAFCFFCLFVFWCADHILYSDTLGFSKANCWVFCPLRTGNYELTHVLTGTPVNYEPVQPVQVKIYTQATCQWSIFWYSSINCSEWPASAVGNCLQYVLMFFNRELVV